MQSLEFSLLIFGLALVRYFLAVLPSLCFEIVMCILCYYMLEVCDLLFDFDFYRRLQLEDYMYLRRNFEL